ncbi:MAG TPA: 50S ribosomal protein L6 [Bacteroidales bacterium]|jgi:large subunit ribosomal protein L6|nr:50S ribosomal protein L6 [Bacteroidales bacterium]MDD4235463.1 50S ribosomal protein L6 [Bacteroidales bacterium]MDY0159911.1 50S ribosomal protein L6 [Bacteroidales bacterium]HXK81843.1 50S ribosomal protein L6 [Bacteroidales bacterium]
MSRIGFLPIEIPEKVSVEYKDNSVKVKGPLGELHQEIHPSISIKVEENILKLERANEEKDSKSMHGLYRSLINNMVKGVSEGFTIQQELVGVGYKAENNGQIIEFALGYSHPIFFKIPDEIQVECKTERRNNPIITLKSYDKQLLGQVAAKIRSFRPPEPYKGKGIKFVGEQLRKKSGKSASV